MCSRRPRCSRRIIHSSSSRVRVLAAYPLRIEQPSRILRLVQVTAQPTLILLVQELHFPFGRFQPRTQFGEFVLEMLEPALDLGELGPQTGWFGTPRQAGEQAIAALQAPRQSFLFLLQASELAARGEGDLYQLVVVRSEER